MTIDNKILQYFTNSQILELLKLYINETDYYLFIKNNVDNSLNKNSLEEYIQNNISITKLLELIKDYDSVIYDKIITEMINNVYIN